MEKSLEGMIACFIRIRFLNFEEWTAASGSTYAFSFLITLTLIMILTPVFLHKNKGELRKPEFVAKYSSLYLSQKLDKLGPKFYQTFFIFRRAFLALLIVYGGRYPTI